jgi:hypothetical protein
MLRRLLRPLWVLTALVFLFEAWLWAHLAPAVRWLVDRIAWRSIKERMAAAIERLPPYPTFLVFLIPVILLLPIKFVGLWMLARGYWLGALATLGAAKVVSMGVTAFIFDLTRPKLLQLPWFASLYQWVLKWLARAHALIDPVKTEVRLWIRHQLGPVLRRLRSVFWLMKPKRAGRFFRRLARIRRRVHSAEYSRVAAPFSAARDARAGRTGQAP